MIGTQITRAALDDKLGTIAQSVNVAFSNVREMHAWLLVQTDAVLEAPPYSYTASEVGLFKSAFTDLDKLRTIYEGSVALPTAQDFRTFAQQVWGFGF